MDQVLPVVFTSVVIILAVILSVVGVQLVMVLMEIKRTLQHVNDAIDSAEQKLNAVVSPLQNLGGMASGLGTGFKVFESFVGWLQRDTSRK